jgi:hypothetical protein
MKNILLSLVFVFSAANAHAQLPKYQGKATRRSNTEAIKLGIKIGPMGTRFINEQKRSYRKKHEKEKILLRFHVGIFGEYKFLGQTGIQFNLFYAGQGQKKEILPRNSYLNHTKTYLDYIVGSVTLRSYRVAGNQFCLFVGPYSSYLMTAKLLKDMSSGKKEEINLLDSKAIRRREELNKFDFGISTGLE